jgi:hypothetical protein
MRVWPDGQMFVASGSRKKLNVHNEDGRPSPTKLLPTPLGGIQRHYCTDPQTARFMSRPLKLLTNALS